MDIHARITALRKARGWSLSKLAKEACIPETTVYNWFNEKHYTPSRDKIEDLCAAFGISVAQFFCEVDLDKLTPNDLRMLEIFHGLPEEKQVLAIELLQGFSK